MVVSIFQEISAKPELHESSAPQFFPAHLEEESQSCDLNAQAATMLDPEYLDLKIGIFLMHQNSPMSWCRGCMDSMNSMKPMKIGETFANLMAETVWPTKRSAA